MNSSSQFLHLTNNKPPSPPTPPSIPNLTSHTLSQRTHIPSHVYKHPSALLLELCTSMKELHQILPLIIKNGLYSEHLFQTKLLSLFCKYGSVNEAARVFEPIEDKLDVLYHTMLKGYAKNSSLHNAMSFFVRMKCDDVKPVVYNFTYLLKVCGDVADLRRGKEIHGQVITNGFSSNVFAMTGVVNLYAKCRQIEDAYKMFDRMPERDLVCWNTIIAGFAQNGLARVALDLVLRMQEEGQKPDSITVVTVLPAAANIGSWRIGKLIHGYAIRAGFELLVNISTALVDMYSKCGSVGTARLIFDRMKQRTVVSWNSMIHGYVQSGDPEEAMAIFQKMLDKGVELTNVTVMEALHACADLGDLERGKFVHKLVDELKLGYDVSVKNSLISIVIPSTDLKWMEHVLSYRPNWLWSWKGYHLSFHIKIHNR
nr:pentatricopeptide repeat-containing protein, chloroplastic [Quercus suber]